MVNQNNLTREIINNPVESPAGTFTFTPVIEETLLTGITEVKVILDQANNEIDVEVHFTGDAPKSTFIASQVAGIQVDEMFIPGFLFQDQGAGLHSAIGIAMLNADQAVARYAAFEATRRVMIAYKTNI